MNITNKDFKAIEAALQTITPERFKQLTPEEQQAVIMADNTMVNLLKKQKANNKRTAEYIANKRVNDKNYAR